MSGRPPHEVHLAPTGHYNYPIHSKLEYPGKVPLRWAAELQALREQDSLKSESPDARDMPTWRLRISMVNGKGNGL